MEISHKEYIEAVNVCTKYLEQQAKQNELRLEFSKFLNPEYLENKEVRDRWMKAQVPFKVKVVYQKRKGIIYKVGDILNVTRVTKKIWLQIDGSSEKEVKEVDLKRDSTYRCQITFYYNLKENGKERLERIYFNEKGIMDKHHREFEILK